ncbi:MAG: 3-isopropylmalate dehydrogenase [Gammaproteobacteria bacterium]|nr:3-isopropylmalate dehydrogenase [Gammaproteobacteria bacterium]
MTKRNILLLPGDGVGPEIMAEAIKVIDIFNEVNLCDVSYDYADIGGVAIDNYGNPYPDETSIKARKADCILLGAVGTKKHENNDNKLKPESGLLALRKSLDLYINVRPVFLFEALLESSTIKPEIIKNLDIVIIRELIGGVYFGEPRGFKDGTNRAGFNTMIYSEKEVSRISKYAFNLSKKRLSRVTSVDKANVLEASQVWRETVSKLHAADYPEIELDHMYVDNAAMQLIKNPKQFDVLLTENLFGDILSDEASMLTGSIGMLPSASLSDINGVYEPIHGSAPDIAGQGIVNPIAMILSVAMMFEYSLNNIGISNIIKTAIENVLRNGIFTKDISHKKDFVSTSAMGDAIIKEIKKDV